MNNSVYQVFQDQIKEMANIASKHKNVSFSFKAPTVKSVIVREDKAVFLINCEPYGDYTTTLSRKGSKFIWTDKEAGIEREFDNIEYLRWEYELPQIVIEIGNQL